MPRLLQHSPACILPSRLLTCRPTKFLPYPTITSHQTLENYLRGQNHSADPHAGFRGSIILEAQLLTSVGGDAALDTARAELGVRVRDALEGAGRSRVRGPAEGDVADDGVADHVAVGRVDGLGAAVLEDGRLDEELCVLASVDAGVDGVKVAAVRG